MTSFLDRVQFSTATTGTGAITPGNASPGFRSSSVLVSGATYDYTITDANNAWEVGYGVWNGTTFSRNLDSSSTGSLLNLSGSAVLAITVRSVTLSGLATTLSLANSAVSTALNLATPRSISATGDGAWSVNFDGSANVSAALTLATVNSNTGSFGSISAIPTFTVNAKGLITSAGSTSVGTNGSALIGYTPANKAGDTFSGAVTFSSTTQHNGIATFSGGVTNFTGSSAAIPSPTGSGLAIGANYSGGSGEVNLWSTYNGAGFYFYQVTGSGTKGWSNIQAGAGTFNGALTSTAGLSATTGAFSGAVSMAGLTATTGSFSGTITAPYSIGVGGSVAAGLYSDGTNVALRGYGTLFLQSNGGTYTYATMTTAGIALDYPVSINTTLTATGAAALNGGLTSTTGSFSSTLSVTGQTTLSGGLASTTVNYGGTLLLANGAGGPQLYLGYTGSNYTQRITSFHNDGSQAGNGINLYAWNYGTDASSGLTGTKLMATFDYTGISFYTSGTFALTGNMSISGSSTWTAGTPYLYSGGAYFVIPNGMLWQNTTYQTGGNMNIRTALNNDAGTLSINNLNTAVTIGTGDANGTLFGPNNSFSKYLKVGGYSTATTYATVQTTNGDLHIGSATSQSIYLNYYNPSQTIFFGGAQYYIGAGGNLVMGAGTFASTLTANNGGNYYNFHNFFVNSASTNSLATATVGYGAQRITQNNSSSGSAYIEFLNAGRYGVLFGLDSATDELSIGGWSAGAVSYPILHSGNYASYISSLNAISFNSSLTNNNGVSVFGYNSAAVPAGGQGLGITWNYNVGNGDVDLWSLYNGSGFKFYQVTGSGTQAWSNIEAGSLTLHGMTNGSAGGAGSSGFYIGYGATTINMYNDTGAHIETNSGGTLFLNQVAGGNIWIGNNNGVNTPVIYVQSGTPRVGINVSSPQYVLDVNGTIHTNSSMLTPTIQVAGSSGIQMTGVGNITWTTSANPTIQSAGSYITVPYGMYFSGGTLYAQNMSNHRGGVNNDTGTLVLSSTATGVVEVVSGNVFTLSSYTVGSLPSASSTPSGTIAIATDCTTTTHRVTPSGGGSNVNLVVCNGSSWYQL